MLGTGKLIFEPGHLLFGRIQSDAQFVAQAKIKANAFDFGPSLQFSEKSVAQLIDFHAHLFEKRTCDAFALIDQGREEVFVGHLLLMHLGGKILRRPHCLLHFLRKLVDAHVSKYRMTPKGQSVVNSRPSHRFWNDSA